MQTQQQKRGGVKTQHGKCLSTVYPLEDSLTKNCQPATPAGIQHRCNTDAVAIYALHATSHVVYVAGPVGGVCARGRGGDCRKHVWHALYMRARAACDNACCERECCERIAV